MPPTQTHPNRWLILIMVQLAVFMPTFSLGIVSGLAASGMLGQWLGWQSVFFVNLLPAIPMLALSLVLLRSTALGTSLAAELVAAWGRDTASHAVIPAGALGALFGTITLLLAVIGGVFLIRNRAAYDAPLKRAVDDEPRPAFWNRQR